MHAKQQQQNRLRVRCSTRPLRTTLYPLEAAPASGWPLARCWGVDCPCDGSCLLPAPGDAILRASLDRWVPRRPAQAPPLLVRPRGAQHPIPIQAIWLFPWRQRGHAIGIRHTGWTWETSELLVRSGWCARSTTWFGEWNE